MKDHPTLSHEAQVSDLSATKILQQIGSSISLDVPIRCLDNDVYDSCFAVSALAASVFGAVGSTIASLSNDAGLSKHLNEVQVSQRIASIWFDRSIFPIGWQLAPAWDSVAGDYKTSDGWIKLHTNLDHHRKAALRVLAVEGKREEVAAAALLWNSTELEREIVEQGGVAAALRSEDEWSAHAQGIAVAAEPLIAWGEPRIIKSNFLPTSKRRPLKGLKVLDLTRVLAGPVATRTLAGFGADVLRIDPPDWDEPYVVPDITLGKRCANLDLVQAKDRQIFEKLLSSADVLVHGYRPGALDDLGYSECVRQKISPRLIEVSLDAYGWTGPWAKRRGFDSLVQMSCGIANTGMHWAGVEMPAPLPVQALDHATGYLMAAAVVKLIRSAINDEGVASARLSLARTAELLKTHPQKHQSHFSGQPREDDFSLNIETTPWGQSKRLRSALNVEGVSIEWYRTANKLGSSAATWLKH